MPDMRAPQRHASGLAISRAEFIALAAALMAMNALAIDIMLPAMQQIGAALAVENENERQFIITAYLLGFGAAQLFFGPVSDRFGRRAPLVAGIAVYVGASILAALAPSFSAMLALRALQGVGAAATRVIAVSIIRDVYGGRQMAQAMSLIIMVFMIVPVLAPGAGQVLLLFAEWPAIFVFMGLLAVAVGIWVFLRLPETLPAERRRPFTPKAVLESFRIVVTHRLAFCYTIATALVFGGLFGFINSAQQVFTTIYDMGVWFPAVFAGLASMMALSSFLSSRLVGRFGMRGLSHFALLGYVTGSTIWMMWAMTGPIPFPAFVVLFGSVMFMFGWLGPNFNALAMEPLGHVAGTASSVLGFVQTLGGALIGAVIGFSFDGTVLPLATGFFLAGTGGLVLVLIAERGKLFRIVNLPAE